jgi:putative FmdB family regulatory protein
MPIYEYKCRKGHTFDVMQRMSDDPVTRCEVCGAPVQRVLHAPSIHFKGSGFHNTDYGTRRRSREARENESSGASEGGGGASTGSDSKTSESSAPAKSGSSSSGSSSSSSSSSSSE